MAEALVNRFYYFSKSAAVKPGKGVHESLTAEAQREGVFNDLPRNFRYMLSNFAEAKFQRMPDGTVRPVAHSSFRSRDDGRLYPTVEHGFHAAKMKEVPGLGETAALSFCVQAGMDRVPVGWSGADAKHARKKLALTSSQLASWDAKKYEVMQQLMYDKFSQDKCLCEVLLATRDAELWHGTRGTKPQRVLVLEAVRNRLRSAVPVFE